MHTALSRNEINEKIVDLWCKTLFISYVVALLKEERLRAELVAYRPTVCAGWRRDAAAKSPVPITGR